VQADHQRVAERGHKNAASTASANAAIEGYFASTLTAAPGSGVAPHPGWVVATIDPHRRETLGLCRHMVVEQRLGDV
jgi:hypothetical protein